MACTCRSILLLSGTETGTASRLAVLFDTLRVTGAWGQKFPTVTATWRRVWGWVIPSLAFSPAVRRVMYTTNGIDSIYSRLYKIVKPPRHFPKDVVAIKLVWLALRGIVSVWVRAAKEWKAAMTQLAIAFGEQFTQPAA